MNNPKDHVCVCVCTYKRPYLLKRLLSSILSQNVSMFDISVVVVDNDRNESAKETVFKVLGNSSIRFKYEVEPEQNISLARNRALNSASGDYIACIDDDEFATEAWLTTLYTTVKKYRADGVLGPVNPFFDIAPPSWIIKGRLCERISLPTGTQITDPRYTRSGNFLISKKVIDENILLFDPAFGRTGGEDVDFFKRMIDKKYSFIWSNEARVFEVVTPQRTKRAFFLKRALLRGVVHARQSPLISLDTIKSLAAITGYTLLLPFLLFFQHHYFLNILIRDCDHIGKILARCGIRVIKQRND